MYSVSVTGMLAPGFPIVVSRTWHVIGGFLSMAMVFALISGFGEVERWFDRACRRVVGVGIRDSGGYGVLFVELHESFGSDVKFVIER